MLLLFFFEHPSAVIDRGQSDWSETKKFFFSYQTILPLLFDGRGCFEEKRRSIELSNLAVREGLDRLLPLKRSALKP
jgi:hypothetical protein